MTAAQDNLEAAIRAVALESGCVEDGDVITTWVLVGSAVDSEPDNSNYFRMYAGGSIQSHVALGLLDYAQTMERAWLFNPHDDEDGQ